MNKSEQLIACLEGEIAKRDVDIERVTANCNALDGQNDQLRAELAAAPEAPAADAGIVDMYRHLQKVTPYRFKKIQDASITDGGDVMYFHKDRFDAELLADMAAHCVCRMCRLRHIDAALSSGKDSAP